MTRLTRLAHPTASGPHQTMISRRRAKLHPYRVAFWSVVALASLVFLLDTFPLTLDAGDPELRGRVSHIDGRGDTLVVISEAQMQRTSEAGALDRSWAWVDLVRQEVGPVTTLDVASLDGEALQAHRVVILSQSAASDPEAAALANALETFVSGGGTLALELPDGPLRTRFAADGGGGWRRGDSITAAEGVPDDVLAEIRNIPILARYRGSTGALAEARTLLAIDGAPVVYTRRMGAGQVVVFDFEVGIELSRLQQGSPGPNFRVQPRVHSQPIRTFDLASTPALMGASIPYADLLERYIAHVVLGDHQPTFALWPYPEGSRGALLTSHDARGLRGRPLWMSIHERSADARSTTFIASPSEPPDPDVLPADAEFVGHAAMLWVLDAADAGLFRRFGLLGFYPVRQNLPLVGQLEQLETALGDDADIRGVRIWDGRWTETFAEPYRIMEAAEFRYSATYGPPPEGPPGYLFGTCQPFTPVDHDGAPFRLREVPVCFDNPETEAELALFREALTNASEGAWAVHLLTSSDRFIAHPDLGGFDSWREALRFADRHDMWVGGAGEFVAFQRRRAAAAMHVISREVTSSTSDGDPQVIEFTVEVETGGRGLVLMVPGAVGALAFDQATRGGPEARLYDIAGQVETTEVEYLGRPVHLLPLNPGFTTVGLRYAR